MLAIVDDLICQLFHGRWAEVVSYSRRGAWACTKPGCRSQANHARRTNTHAPACTVSHAPAPRRRRTQAERGSRRAA
jgi:hypothetical protein